MQNPVIANPCPEKWEGMTRADQGRYCGKCSKIVIDFTKKTTQQIIDFLNARKGEDICGKLRVQVAVRSISVGAGDNKFRPYSQQLRVFTLAVFAVFGSLLFTACGSTEHEEPVGKIGIDSTLQAQQEHKSDSIAAQDSTKTTKVDSTDDLDSAEIMRTMKILDSIQLLKKK